MRTTHLWIMLGTLTGGLAFWPAVTRGQDRNAADIQFGDGVHAYFAGNSSRAEQSLSNALTYESQDPRIYYFRALSLLRQGRTAEARGDMMVGAALEAQRPNRYAIGAALMRVQGRDRLLLEQYRRQARLEASSSGAGRDQVAPAAHSEGLRQRVVIPLEELLREGTPRSAAPSATQPPPRTFAPSSSAPPAPGPAQIDGQEDPFRDDPQTPVSAPAAPAASEPAPTEAPAESSPAGADNEDPFSDF